MQRTLSNEPVLRGLIGKVGIEHSNIKINFSYRSRKFSVMMILSMFVTLFRPRWMAGLIRGNWELQLTVYTIYSANINFTLNIN